MSFVVSNHGPSVAAELQTWDQAFQRDDSGLAAGLLRRVDRKTRALIGELADWMKGSDPDAPARRHFYHTVMGAHPDDTAGHQELEPVMQQILSGTCNLTREEDGAADLFIVRDALGQPIARFLAGERRAFMEMTARRVAYMLGLEAWVAPFTIMAAADLFVAQPTFDQSSPAGSPLLGSPDEPKGRAADALDAEDHLSHQVVLQMWDDSDERWDEAARTLQVKTFGWHNKVFHPDVTQMPGHTMAGAVLGVVTPLPKEAKAVSPQEYDARFLGLTVASLALGRGDSPSGGVVGDVLIDSQLIMPTFLDPTDRDSRMANAARSLTTSCGTAILFNRIDRATQEQLPAGDPAQQRVRSLRPAVVPQQLAQAMQRWSTEIESVKSWMRGARPLFMDAELRTMEDLAGDLDQPVLLQDSLGCHYHLEACTPDPGHGPSLPLDGPAFGLTQIRAFERRTQRILRTLIHRGAEPIEPLALVEQVDQAAAERCRRLLRAMQPAAPSMPLADRMQEVAAMASKSWAAVFVPFTRLPKTISELSLDSRGRASPDSPQVFRSDTPSMWRELGLQDSPSHAYSYASDHPSQRFRPALFPDDPWHSPRSKKEEGWLSGPLKNLLLSLAPRVSGSGVELSVQRRFSIGLSRTPSPQQEVGGEPQDLPGIAKRR